MPRAQLRCSGPPMYLGRSTVSALLVLSVLVVLGAALALGVHLFGGREVKLRPMKLPNGIEIVRIGTRMETAALFREVFVDRVYFKHGIELSPGATVFDVGANIGMFSLSVLSDLLRVKIFAFEPVPALFQALRENVRKK